MGSLKPELGAGAGRIQLHRICPVADLRAGEGRELVLECGDSQQHIVVFALAGKIHAYANVCPHQGRSLSWAPNEFLITPEGRLICPHHGASFELDSGACVEGPCRGAALNRIDVEVRDGQVYARGSRPTSPSSISSRTAD